MWRHRRSITLVLSSCFAVWAATAGAQDARSYYDPSEAAVRQLQTVEQYHWGKGVQNMDDRNWPLAMAEWDFILWYFPNHPRVLYMMSTTAIKGNMLDRAEEYFNIALRMYPNTASTYAVYGIHLFNLNKTAEAIEAYEQSLDLDPASAETHYNLGMAYAAAGRSEQANRHAQAAYSLGFPLPALRRKLERTGAWKPLAEQDLQTLVSRAPQ